jgi:polyisoprenoid-binding protein YceI
VNKIKFTKDGTYSVKVNGDLKIKDVSKPIKVEEKITVAGSKIKVVADFKIKLSEYNISGQPIDAGKVDKEPKITVTAEF